MAHRIARLDMDVLVLNGIISIYDDGGAQSVPNLNNLAEWLFVGTNAVVAASAGRSDHYAALALEVWDGEPPADPAGWEARAERGLRLDSGDLEVHPGSAPPYTQVLRIGPPGRYHLRGYAAGRAEIQRLTPNPDIYALRGTERFLFQLWPAE